MALLSTFHKFAKPSRHHLFQIFVAMATQLTGYKYLQCY